jgi:hypothetical protein
VLLRQLGMPASVCRSKLWERDRGELEAILYDAHQRYLDLARQVHPRKSDDDRESATQLNTLWDVIQKRFSDHLNPRNILRARAARKRQLGGRRCALGLCGKRFIRKAKRGPAPIYCSRRCMHAVARLRYEQRARNAKPRFYRKCELRGCNQRFVTTNRRKKFHSIRCARTQALRRHYVRNNGRLQKANWLRRRKLQALSMAA